ncbi:MAG: class I SAM-dependent methyltransferase [Steroidobacteraceae bacterium]
MTPCPLCASLAQRPAFAARDYEHGVVGEWSIARCDACGLYFQAPLPHPAQIPSFYPPSYSAYNSDTLISLLFRFIYRLDARRVAKLIGRTGRVLDIGCGNGSALLQLRKRGRWQLCGLEFDESAAAKARERGLDVRSGDVLDCDFPDRSFDLIRMGHVIEHVVDPAATISRVYSLLKPGGVLYGETPNTNCLDFRIFGRYWGALHAPRHLTFFNSANLHKLLTDTGFSEIRIAPRLRTVGWSCGIQNLLADKGAVKVPDTGRVPWYVLLIVPFLPVTLLQSLFGTTATIAFIARKPA